MSRIFALTLSSILIACCGCNPDYELETAVVRGVVTYNGRPLEAGEVAFVPTRGRGATGMIAADGTYTVSTYRDGDGALVGTHTVTVYPRYPKHENDQIPTGARMVSEPMSGIQVNVEPGIENVIDLKLTKQ